MKTQRLIITALAMGLFFAFGSTGCGLRGTRASVEESPKQECQNLMNELLPFAERMLEKYGQFYPFGAAMSPDGTIVHTEVGDGSEYPQPETLLSMLSRQYQKSAREGKIKACAIVTNVKVLLAGSVKETDAIQVYLDHRDNYSVEVFQLYRINDAGKLLLGKHFIQAGKGIIFTKGKKTAETDR